MSFSIWEEFNGTRQDTRTGGGGSGGMRGLLAMIGSVSFSGAPLC